MTNILNGSVVQPMIREVSSSLINAHRSKSAEGINRHYITSYLYYLSRP
jgi:hypothetical protein